MELIECEITAIAFIIECNGIYLSCFCFCLIYFLMFNMNFLDDSSYCLCVYRTALAERLSKHKLVHSETKPYMCDECDFSTQHEQAMQIHKSMHSTVSAHRCDLCDFRSPDGDALKTHATTVHPNSMPLTCDRCDFTTKCRNSLAIHSRLHPIDQPYKCEQMQCDFTTKSSSELQQHALLHNSVRPFTCNECSLSFKALNHLKLHKRAHQTVKPYSCEACGKAYISKGSLQNHQAANPNHKLSQCGECGLSFTDLGKYRRHLRTVHGQVESGETCSECHSMFKSKSNLLRHISHVHKKEKNYACIVCGEKFATNSSLQIHVTREHGRKDSPLVNAEDTEEGKSGTDAPSLQNADSNALGADHETLYLTADTDGSSEDEVMSPKTKRTKKSSEMYYSYKVLGLPGTGMGSQSMNSVKSDGDEDPGPCNSQGAISKISKMQKPIKKPKNLVRMNFGVPGRKKSSKQMPAGDLSPGESCHNDVSVGTPTVEIEYDIDAPAAEPSTEYLNSLLLAANYNNGEGQYVYQADLQGALAVNYNGQIVYGNETPVTGYEMTPVVSDTQGAPVTAQTVITGEGGTVSQSVTPYYVTATADSSDIMSQSMAPFYVTATENGNISAAAGELEPAPESISKDTEADREHTDLSMEVDEESNPVLGDDASNKAEATPMQLFTTQAMDNGLVALTAICQESEPAYPVVGVTAEAPSDATMDNSQWMNVIPAVTEDGHAQDGGIGAEGQV